MTLEQQKTELKNYRDLYGQLLQDWHEIDKANTYEDLKEIIYNHECHLESCLSDAQSSLNNLLQKIK
jgi:hypothetical protein